jgi:hypothetical protein
MSAGSIMAWCTCSTEPRTEATNVRPSCRGVESDLPEMKGEMLITTTLQAIERGTLLEATHEGLPRGVSASDNELGSRHSLATLARLLEAGGP